MNWCTAFVSQSVHNSRHCRKLEIMANWMRSAVCKTNNAIHAHTHHVYVLGVAKLRRFRTLRPRLDLRCRLLGCCAAAVARPVLIRGGNTILSIQSYKNYVVVLPSRLLRCCYTCVRLIDHANYVKLRSCAIEGFHLFISV